MRNCYQFQNQNMLQHGLSVFRHTIQLISGNSDNFKLPTWYIKYKHELLSNIHDFKTIKHYTIFHDCGKNKSKIIDEDGKIHYPDHANVSANMFKENIRNDEKVVNLIRYDMIFHTWKYENIIALKLDSKTLFTLLITALAELHANSEMFGKESDSFIIKFKKLEKLGNKICRYFFEKAYVYTIIRTDLSLPQQIVQNSHVSLEIGRNFINTKDEHPSIIVCSAKNENKLKDAIKYLHENNIKFIAFREPDRGNEITALATEPLCGDRRIPMKKFQLIKEKS